MTIFNPDAKTGKTNQVEPVCLKQPKRTSLSSKMQFKIPMIVINLVIIFSIVFLPGTDNPKSWVNMNPETSPPEQGGGILLYHPPTDDVIMFSGQYEAGLGTKSYHSIWTYSVNDNNWSDVTKSKMSWENPKMAYEVTYDSKNEIFIIFGGDNKDFITSAETWAFNYSSGTWINMSPSTTPPKRIFHCMTYDSQSERVIMYGGLSTFFPPNIFYHDIWIYDYLTNTWENVTPSINPQGRAKADLVYDAKADRVLLFGGFTEKPDKNPTMSEPWGGFKQDLWTFDLESKSWLELTPETSPPERAYHKMVYDSKADRTILFGGVMDKISVGDEVYQDTWMYKYNTNTWTEITSSNLPPARWAHGLTYDSESDQIVLYGGFTAPGYYFMGDTWTFRHSTTNTESIVILRNLVVLIAIVGTFILILITFRPSRTMK